MKDCPWCHIDPNEISALRQRVAELEREQSALTKMAREAIPDYPFDPKHPLPLREAVYGLTQALEGTTLACGDLWKDLEAAIGDRDAAQDAIQQTHIALGGDGEWVFRMPAPHAPESGNLLLDVPALAKEMAEELATYRAAQTKEPRDDE